MTYTPENNQIFAHDERSKPILVRGVEDEFFYVIASDIDGAGVTSFTVYRFDDLEEAETMAANGDYYEVLKLRDRKARYNQ